MVGGLNSESSGNEGTSSLGSTPTQARDRSHTEGSNSMDLEWDHDDGNVLLLSYTLIISFYSVLSEYDNMFITLLKCCIETMY